MIVYRMELENITELVLQIQRFGFRNSNSLLLFVE